MLRPGPAVWKTSPWAQQAWKQGWSPIHLKSLHLNAYANVEVGKQANQNLSPHLTTFLSATAFELDLAQSQLCSYRCVPFPRHWKVFLKHILMEEAGHPFIQTQICSGGSPPPPLHIPPKKGYLSTQQKTDFYYFKLRESFLHVHDICSHTDLLLGRDAVPEQPFTIESKGAFSTSPKTQKLPRTTHPPRDGAGTRTLASTRRRRGREGANL